MTNTIFEVILGIFFLKISNTEVSFGEKTLTWKFYIINMTLSTTKQVQIIYPKEFIIMAFDTGSEKFVVHVAIWEHKKIAINLIKKT